ncbi:MAG: DUF5320 domain-containing protein [Bacteroidales bacterium]
MPAGDRTGPEGKGPRTGRGFGFCSGYDAPGNSRRGGGRFGRGQGNSEGGGDGSGRGQGNSGSGGDGSGRGQGNGRGNRRGGGFRRRMAQKGPGEPQRE